MDLLIPDDGQTRVRQKQIGPDLREGQQRRLLLHAVGEGGGVADLQSGVLERHQPPLLQRRGQLFQQRLQQLRRRAPARLAHNLSHAHKRLTHFYNPHQCRKLRCTRNKTSSSMHKLNHTAHGTPHTESSMYLLLARTAALRPSGGSLDIHKTA